MKRRLFLAACTLAATFAHAENVRGSGQAATEQRQASGIHGVAMSVPGQLEVRQGEPERVTITADDNLLPYLETVMEDGVLHVRTKPNTSVSLRTPLRVSVVARSIEKLSLSGSGGIDASAIDVPRLALHISGSGKATLAGHAGALDARISGSGRVDATKLAVDDAAIGVSGSGHLQVAARKSLKTHISGSGSVEYYGDPTVEKHVSGVGRIIRAGAAPG